MSLTSTILKVLDAVETEKDLRSFTDAAGKHIAAVAAVDSTGAAVELATEANQDIANTALGAPASAEALTGDGNIIALLKALRTILNTRLDFDTGAGTQNVALVGVALPASGGAVAGGTQSNPFSVVGTRANDGTGGVSGTHLTIGGSDGTNVRPLTVDTAGRGIVKPQMASGGFATKQTAATGTNWTAFDSQDCTRLLVNNQTGTAIELRQGGPGAAFPLATTQMVEILGITNANQIEIRRVDTSNTQVTVAARWES